MKTAEEILKSWHQDFDQEIEVVLKRETVILAMQEYAEEYYRERLREKPKPYSDDFKHKDCPL